MCAEHPDAAATGKCITCNKLVCDACGGVVNNRGVYCIDHTPVVTTAGRASPGMNPLLAGAGGDLPGTAVVAKKSSPNTGLIMGLVGLIALILAVVVLLVTPGVLKSPELATGFTAGAGVGAPSPYGAPMGAVPGDPYAGGIPSGPYSGPPGGFPGGAVPGSPYAGGPPGAVPGAPGGGVAGAVPGSP
jgi:hypothetical protein